MKIIRDSNEDEMIACFLNGEIFSSRFAKDLENTLAELKYDKKIIKTPNTKDPLENQKRKRVLSEFRNYDKDQGLFEGFPKVNAYKVVEFMSDDLKNIRYVNYDYWNELSDGTGSPVVASQNIRLGKTVFDVSNAPFLDGARLLENGAKFKPCILLTFDYKTFVILEGHSRITCYALYPKAFDNVRAIVLECNKEEIENWNA